MRISHLTVSIDPVRGGPPAIALRIAAAQAAQGHEVEVIGHMPTDMATSNAMVREVLGHERLTIRHLPLPYSLRLLWGNHNIFPQRPDFIQLHEAWDPIMAAAGAEARRAGVPYTVTTHGVLQDFRIKQKWLKKKVGMALWTRRLLSGTKFIHAGTRYEVGVIDRLKFGRPAVQIPNGISPQEYAQLPDPAVFRRSVPALGDAPYIIFVSRLHHLKGTHLLAEAFAKIAAKHPEVHLVVAGPDWGSAADTKQRITRHGLDSRTHFVGSLGGERKFAAIHGATIWTLPSYDEGFSMAVLEALGCGTPSVITEGCHFPEVAVEGAGLVVQPNEQQLATALDLLLSDSSRRTAMGKRGRELVMERYTWDKIARDLLAAYTA